jgi:hypothetical protein
MIISAKFLLMASPLFCCPDPFFSIPRNNKCHQKISGPACGSKQDMLGVATFQYFFEPVITEGFSIYIILEFYYHLGIPQLCKVKFIFT